MEIQGIFPETPEWQPSPKAQKDVSPQGLRELHIGPGHYSSWSQAPEVFWEEAKWKGHSLASAQQHRRQSVAKCFQAASVLGDLTGINLQTSLWDYYSTVGSHGACTPTSCHLGRGLLNKVSP